MHFYCRLAGVISCKSKNKLQFWHIRLTICADLLTLDNEVDVGETGLVIGLEAAGVRPLVGYLHIVNVNGEVTAIVIDQRHTLVQCPFIGSCEKDV